MIYSTQQRPTYDDDLYSVSSLCARFKDTLTPRIVYDVYIAGFARKLLTHNLSVFLVSSYYIAFTFTCLSVVSDLDEVHARIDIIISGLHTPLEDLMNGLHDIHTNSDHHISTIISMLARIYDNDPLEIRKKLASNKEHAKDMWRFIHEVYDNNRKNLSNALALGVAMVHYSSTLRYVVLNDWERSRGLILNIINVAKDEANNAHEAAREFITQMFRRYRPEFTSPDEYKQRFEEEGLLAVIPPPHGPPTPASRFDSKDGDRRVLTGVWGFLAG
jgi:hypothetical protein